MFPGLKLNIISFFGNEEESQTEAVADADKTRLFRVHCAFCSVQYAVFSVQWAVCSAQCKMCSVQCLVQCSVCSA